MLVKNELYRWNVCELPWSWLGYAIESSFCRLMVFIGFALGLAWLSMGYYGIAIEH